MPGRKRGGQPGNKNACGNRGGGAPHGNQNALKHGGYAAVRWQDLTDRERELVASMPTDCRELLIDEIKLLSVRERRLMQEIAWMRSVEGGLLEDGTVEIRDSGADDGLPGQPYRQDTLYVSADTVVLRLENILTACQRQRAQAAVLLAQMSAGTPPATISGFAVAVIAELLGKNKDLLDGGPSHAGR